MGREATVGLVLLLTWSGCAAIQQVSQSAADHAKPAAPPVLADRPPSSAAWPDAPTTFRVGGRHFAVSVAYDLFNKLSVKLGGQVATELTRGSSPGYPPIDPAQLAPGKVYFRLTSLASDANHQTELDVLEVVDEAGVLTDSPWLVSRMPLVVGETSINPAYAGTAQAYQESAWTVVLDRSYLGPPGSGGVGKCTFDVTDPFVATGYYAPPGQAVNFGVDSTGCRAVGFMVAGQPKDLVQYPDDSHRFGYHTFQVPAGAANGDDLKFQVYGLDLMKRASYYDVHVVVRTATAPPPPPCDPGNGFGGNKGPFVFCASCGSQRLRFGGSYCSATEARAAATSALAGVGLTGCSLAAGECSACPVSTANPAGQPQAFPYCVACPAGVFAWNVAGGSQIACSRDDATQIVQLGNGLCSVTPALPQSFDVCVQCPGQALQRVPVSACTAAQAVDMARAQAATTCTVASCP